MDSLGRKSARDTDSEQSDEEPENLKKTKRSLVLSSSKTQRTNSNAYIGILYRVEVPKT